MFDQPAYTVDEGGVVDVVVQLCGNITNYVVVTFTTNDDTAGIARPSTVMILVHFRRCMDMHVHVSTIMRQRSLCVHMRLAILMYTFPPHSPLTVAGSDYTSVSVDLVFSATTTSQTVMIVTHNDNRVETREMFTITLTITGSAVKPPSVFVTVSIIDTTSEYMHVHVHVYGHVHN